MSTPTSIGYGSGYRMAYYNSGKMTNKGWEFRANIIALKRKDFQLGFNFNINQNTNKITEIPVNYTEENYTFGNGNYAFRYEVDRPLGSFYGYRYKGVYQNAEATHARDAEGNIMKDVKGNPIVMMNGHYTVAPGDAIYLQAIQTGCQLLWPLRTESH